MEDINSRDLFLACHFSPEMVCVVLTKNFAPEAVSVLDGRTDVFLVDCKNSKEELLQNLDITFFLNFSIFLFILTNLCHLNSSSPPFTMFSFSNLFLSILWRVKSINFNVFFEKLPVKNENFRFLTITHLKISRCTVDYSFHSCKECFSWQVRWSLKKIHRK